MRLSPREIAAIKQAAHEAFGEGVVVRLFGSRVDDGIRGGDVDLHVSLPDAEPASGARSYFRRLLDRTVGERDYDIVIAGRAAAPTAIDQAARRHGVVL